MIFRIGRAPTAYDSSWMNRTLSQISQGFSELSAPWATGYSATPVTETRTFDPATVTHAELADVLATLISDLKTKGKLG